MGGIRLVTSLSQQTGKDQPHNNNHHGVVIEEIDGLIKVYKDGHVERPQIVPCVTTSLAPELRVTCKDIIIDKITNIWARCYVPQQSCQVKKLPLLVYFHGGGFCAGSAAWCCYHEFLATLSFKSNCLVMSVNYRLAPENPLPSAYDDGVNTVKWLKQQALFGPTDHQWWARHCDFSNIFLAGDSAGANIAHNVAARLGWALNPLDLKGTILIQPFFGGEARTYSEKYTVTPPGSALSLAAADTYWQLALPCGANRDHPWCNPMVEDSVKFGELRHLPLMVCISEMDILRDRNLEFCCGLASKGKRVEKVVYKGVGHAFHILNRSQLSQVRTAEMISHIKDFIERQ